MRQKLNDGERKILEALESDLGRPLTEEEEPLGLSQARSSRSHALKSPDESRIAFVLEVAACMASSSGAPSGASPMPPSLTAALANLNVKTAYIDGEL